jgi:dihydrodipicolinate synthase/N-acetylneuraminate lyase
MNKQDFAKLIQKISNAYQSFNYPSLTGFSLTKRQVKAIKEVVNLLDVKGFNYFHDEVRSRQRK